MNNNTTVSPEELLAVARVLFDARGDTSTLVKAIATEARALIPGAEHVSVVVLNKDELERTASSEDLAGVCDALQRDLGEGPTLSAAVDRDTVLVKDLRRETRWPRFAPAAAARGVRAMLCLPFEVAANRTAAVNVYSTSENAFTADSRAVAELFTAHAAVAFAADLENSQLNLAVDSRDTIGQAKGMLMERFGIGSDQAFSLLRKLSQDSNVKLATLAQRVIDAGSGVGDPPRQSPT